MVREFKDFLKDIQLSIQNIEDFVAGMGKEGFFEDLKTQNAVIRSLEVIGEAVKKLPQKLKNNYSEIDWQSIAGTRDVLVHAYYRIDLERIWEIVNEDLPSLKETIARIMEEKNEN